MSDFYENNYNPDVLSCIANLSNDEVFTPPNVANAMLDMLPQELFESKETKFLDPACKSGVFLREIAKRLLANAMPNYKQKLREYEDNKNKSEDPSKYKPSQDEQKFLDELQKAIDHIFKNQLYGIAITELTSLLSRRSVYCSKYPNCRYSVTKFDNSEGNIFYKDIKHTWDKGSCIYCGASQDKYDRGDGKESHAYQFIHNNIPQELKNMKFDVIISNPPYQMSDGGGDGSSAKPLYHNFVLQAKKLNPRYIIMIIPARWYSGGKGLDVFRDEMLNDLRIEILHDFPETKDCFPGINIRGGICYFLWNRNNKNKPKIINHYKNSVNSMERNLLENKNSTFIRYNKAISVFQKVKQFNEQTMENKVSSRLPFDIASNFSDFSLTETPSKNIMLFRSERGNSKDSNKIVYINENCIKKNIEWKDKIKVLVSKASPGGDEYPHSIITQPIIAPKNSVCTETYLIVDFVENKTEGENLISYMKTRFFRFLVSLIKNTQNISKNCFSFVPLQDFSKPWTDEELYKKYNLTNEEIEFIESMIKEME